MRGLHGDVSTGTHCNADIGLRKRRCIVDAVACHGHTATLALQARNELDFVSRFDFADDLVNA